MNNQFKTDIYSYDAIQKAVHKAHYERSIAFRNLIGRMSGGLRKD